MYWPRKVFLVGLLGLPLLLPQLGWVTIAHATAAKAQECGNFSAALSATITCTFGASVTATNTVACLATAGTLVQTVTLTDTAANTYSGNPNTYRDDTPNTHRGLAVRAFNVTGGFTVVTATWSVAVTNLFVKCQEISGLLTTDPNDVAVGQVQASVGTTTDGVTSTAVTATLGGAYVLGLSVNTDLSCIHLAAGTGYTLDTPGGGDCVVASEHQIKTSAGSIAATFTAGAGTHSYLTTVQVFKAQSVAFGTISATVTSSNTVNVAYPASLAAGDLLVLCVTNKYPTNAPSTPSAWTLPTDGQASGGSDPDGVDTGHVYSTIFTKVATGSESGTLTVTATSANVITANMSRYTKVLPSWSVAAANGADNSFGTGWSVVAGTDPGVQSRDMIFTCSGVNTDIASFSAESMSQTGATFAAAVERYDNGTSTGDDMATKVVDFIVTGGTSSTAPTYTATAASGGGAGSTAFLRIRESSVPQARPQGTLTGVYP